MSREPIYDFVNGVRVTVTQSDDPAYALLLNPRVFSTPTIYRGSCYICLDSEFADMGLPLCTPCGACKTGHVAADSDECDDCGADAYELWMEAQGS